MHHSRYFSYVLCLLGCWWAGVGFAQQPPQPEAASKVPTYLRLPLDGQISTLDPAKVQFLDAIELTEQLFLGLTDFNPKDYSVVPELALNWETNADGTVYVFRLRQNVKWTDGSPVTAHDLVWAVERNLKPETDSPYVHTLYIIKQAKAFHDGQVTDFKEVGVKALDDFTVEFTLEHSATYFPAMASLWVYRPLPRQVIEKFQADWTEVQHIQTNGSYKVKEYKKGNVLVLEKNLDYYDADRVEIGRIHYYIVPESSLGLAMYESNELDVLGEGYLRVPANELPRIRTNPILRRDLRIAPLFCTESYVFNTKLAPVDSPLVRKALVAGINRRLLIDFVVQSRHQLATTFTRPPVFGSVDPSEGVGIHFNPTQAQAWLQEAGYPNAKGLADIVLVHNTSETHSNNAKALQTMLKHYLNVNLIPREVDFDTYISVVGDPKDTHLFRIGFCSDYPDANNWLHESFHPVQSPNYARWDNKEFATLTEAAQSLNDPVLRKQKYRRAEEILAQEEAAIMPLYFSTGTYLVKPWVKNWYSMAFGGQQIRHWKLDSEEASNE